MEGLSAVTDHALALAGEGAEAEGGERGGGDGGKKAARSYGFEEAAQLEREKLSILKQMSRDRELLTKTMDRIQHNRAETEQLKESLAKTSGMFLDGKETTKVTVKDKDGKDQVKTVVVKPLGTRDAVVETRRIIERRLTKLRQSYEVVEVKLNRQRGQNARLKHQINTMRREAVVFDELFDQMCSELMDVKKRTETAKMAISEAYASRDASRAEAQSVLDAMYRERAAAQEEFDQQSQALAEADVQPDSKAPTTTGLLTAEEEDRLKKKIVDTAWKIQEQRSKLAKAKEKATVFDDAIEQVKDATGFESLEELVEQMNAAEEEKFAKISYASRLIGEVESLEKAIEKLRDDYKSRQTSTAEKLTETTEQVADLQRKLQEGKVDLHSSSAALKATKKELAIVMPLVSDLFYAAGCHTVFDEAFVKSSVIKHRSYALAKPRGPRDDEEPSTDKPSIASELGIPRVSTGDDAEEDDQSAKADEDGEADEDRIEDHHHLTRHPSLYPGDDSPSKTPSSRRSLAMRMFARIPAFRHVLDDGINQHTLDQFMSVLDQKTAELVQFFVFLMQQGALTTKTSTSRPGKAPTCSSDDPRAIVGPTAPSGAVAKSLTSSALMASILSTDMTAPHHHTADEARPLSLAEIRSQAAASLTTPEFAAFRTASKDAAEALSKQTTAKTPTRHGASAAPTPAPPA